MKQIIKMNTSELAGEVRSWEEGIHTAGLLRHAARLGELKERLVKLTLGEDEIGFWEGAGYFLARLLKVEQQLIEAAGMKHDAEPMARMGLFKLARDAGHYIAVRRCIVDSIADYLLNAAASGDWIFQDWSDYEEDEVLERLMSEHSDESIVLMKRDLVNQCMPVHLSCAMDHYDLREESDRGYASSYVADEAYDAAMDLLVEEAMNHIELRLELLVLDAMMKRCRWPHKSDDMTPEEDSIRIRDACRALASTVALFNFDEARVVLYIARVQASQIGGDAEDEQA